MLVHQDREQLLPDLVARLVVRSARIRRPERRGPVGGAQPDVRPVRLHPYALGRRLLVEPDGRLDRRHQLRRCLQPRHLRIGLGPRRRTLGDQVPQGARPDPLLPEARQHIGDVPEIGLVGPDEQHPAAAVAEARVGVQQIGGAVQRHDGLPRAGPAVDDERAPGTRPDDGVLVGLDGAQHIAHPGRPGRAQTRDERGPVVQRGMAGEALRREHLVPEVADPAAGPPVAAAAHQAHRVAVGGPEERLGGRRAPVDQQSAARAVGQAEPSHVQRLGAVGGDHAPEAQVEAEPAQGTQPGGQPVDLHVPVHRRPARPAGRAARGREPFGELGDRLFQAVGDGREVLLVLGDQRRVGLGGEPVGEVERAGGQGCHVVSSDLRCLRGRRPVPATADDSAAFGGSCRKAPHAL
ncbi:hypothetical protein P376_5063 [Streptomyces sp. HCCB10043]|nr:hypothetical protein P376_5063 [Streptomyces sp. HCCB10043]